MWTVFVHKTDRECKLEPLDGGSGPTLSDSIRKQRPAAPDAQPLSAASAGSAGVDRGVMTQSGAASSRSLQMWGAVPPLTYVSISPLDTHLGFPLTPASYECADLSLWGLIRMKVPASPVNIRNTTTSRAPRVPVPL